MEEEWQGSRARQDQAGLETTARDAVACRTPARLVAQSGEVAMRTRREGAVQDQTWVTSNPRERQGSRGTQSRLDRGAAQRKSPSPAPSSQWPALISCLCVVRPPEPVSRSLLWPFSLALALSLSLSVCVPLSFSSRLLVGGCGPPWTSPSLKGPVVVNTVVPWGV